MPTATPPRPKALLLPGALALLAGLWAGLARLGWPLPLPVAHWPADHGPLLVGGFLGTLIGLERAVGLAGLKPRRWPYLVPVSCGLGALALLLGAPGWVPKLLITLGSCGLVAVFGVLLRRRLEPAGVAMWSGAVAWAAGNLVWLAGAPLPHAAVWWLGFLALMIAGERVELSRVVIRGALAHHFLVLCLALVFGGLAGSLIHFSTGVRVAGLGLAATGVWLLHYDIARRTVRATGLPRFVALCLLPGFAWLVVAGALWLAAAPAMSAGPLYDAMLHAVLVGFAFSMIFGHAPIILPVVTGLRVPYSPLFYLPLVLLHASLAARLAGDLSGAVAVRQWGGLGNAVAVGLFLVFTVAAVVRAPRAPGPGPAPRPV
jgi:hypothetical protein